MKELITARISELEKRLADLAGAHKTLTNQLNQSTNEYVRTEGSIMELKALLKPKKKKKGEK